MIYYVFHNLQLIAHKVNLAKDMNDSFLQALLGKDCISALHQATRRSPDLATAIQPIALISWLGALGSKYDGVLPGLGLIKFERIDNTYTGEVTFNDQVFSYRRVKPIELASLISVSFGGLPPIAKPKGIDKLIKSLDKMVGAVVDSTRKAEVFTYLAKAAKQLYCTKCFDPLDKNGHCKIKGHWAELDKIEPKGQPAKPILANPPVPAVGATPAKAPTLVQAPKAPKAPIIGKTLKMEKYQASKVCVDCNQGRFKNQVFVGCPCFKELAKSATTIVLPSGNYLLKFAVDADLETFAALAASVQ